MDFYTSCPDGFVMHSPGMFCSLSLFMAFFIILNPSEVFVIVSLTLFLPICLEQFARDNGFLLPEKQLPCSILKSDHVPYGRETLQDASRCVVKIGWAWIDTASFRYVEWFYCPMMSLRLVQFIHVFHICCSSSTRRYLHGFDCRPP